MGHAGTDFEIEWRSVEELVAVEATDPLLRSAAIALESGLETKESLLAKYEAIRKKCFAAAEEADRAPEADRARRRDRAARAVHAGQGEGRSAARGLSRTSASPCSAARRSCRKTCAPRHLAIQINNALHDLFCKVSRNAAVRRGRRAEGRRLHGHQGTAQGVQERARVQHAARRDDDPRPRAGLRQHGHAAGAGDPVPRVFPQRLRPDPRRGGVAAVLLERPVPQPDGRAHRRRSVISAASAGISTTTIRSRRCAIFPASSSAAPAAATMRR